MTFDLTDEQILPDFPVSFQHVNHEWVIKGMFRWQMQRRWDEFIYSLCVGELDDKVAP